MYQQIPCTCHNFFPNSWQLPDHTGFSFAGFFGGLDQIFFQGHIREWKFSVFQFLNAYPLDRLWQKSNWHSAREASPLWNVFRQSFNKIFSFQTNYQEINCLNLRKLGFGTFANKAIKPPIPCVKIRLSSWNSNPQEKGSPVGVKILSS